MADHRRDKRLSLPSHALQRKTLEMLWERDRSSIRDIADRLESNLGSGVPYNTVASVLNTLCRLGFATRVRMQGRREYLYSALVSREQQEKAVTRDAVRSLLDGTGSSRKALSYLVDIVSQSGSGRLKDLDEAVAEGRRAAKIKGKP